MAAQKPAHQLTGANRTSKGQKTSGESQGGGFRGGPKRWTGRGPPPARHIPWPEIFKHHISVVEGHRKMVDMVRKHTVEGTGNFRTIDQMFKRANEMLFTSKQLERSFLPPPNQRDQVPLGVDSASMYPGYSPADHEYGKAAEDYGKAVAEAKRRGVEIPKHPDIDYEIGQSKGVKRKPSAQMKEPGMLKELQGGSGSGSGSGEDEGAAKKQRTNGQFTPAEVNAEETAANTADQPSQGENPYFVIDTNPTPVNLTTNISSPSKREAHNEDTTGPRKKRSRVNSSGSLPNELGEHGETEDISAKVDAKMREKEQKRKNKELKKRKRESDSGEIAPQTIIETGPEDGKEDNEKPAKKKKKAKVTNGENELPDRTIEKKDIGHEVGDERKKKKAKKSHKSQ